MNTITNTDNFYLNIDDTVFSLDIRKNTAEFGDIDGNNLPIYFDKRPVNVGRGRITLDYTVTTVDGAAPTSAANLKALIEVILSQTGSNNRSIIFKTTGYEIQPEDDIVVGDGTFTFSIHTSVGYLGVAHTIKNEGTGEINIVPDGAETIDGVTPIILTQWESITIVSDNTNWLII